MNDLTDHQRARPGAGRRGDRRLGASSGRARSPRLGPPDRTPRDASELIDGGGRLLTPGLIDIHTHGIEQFAYESGPEQIVAAARRLGQYGTTCVLPTLYRVMSPERLGELERLAAALPQCEDACMPGFHLEGPFLALPGAGAQTIPGDVGLLDELLAAAGGKVLAMSISPEMPNILPVIERLCELGIVPFITHTRATVEQTEAAIDAGARHATHFYDVFPLPEETEPGVRPVGAVEAILADSALHGRLHRRRRPRASDGRQGGAGGEGFAQRDRWRPTRTSAPGCRRASTIRRSAARVRIAPGDARPHPPARLAAARRAGRQRADDGPRHRRICWHGSICRRSRSGRWAAATRPGCWGWPPRALSASAPTPTWFSGIKPPAGLRAVRTWVGGRCVYESIERSQLRSIPMRSKFTYASAPVHPFTDVEVCDRVMQISREDLCKHPNPKLKIGIIEDDTQFTLKFLLDILGGIKRSLEEGQAARDHSAAPRIRSTPCWPR